MYTMSSFCKKVGLSRMTILKLEKEGIITPLRTPTGHRRFTDENIKQIYEYLQKGKNISNNKKTVIYCRISTKEQEQFLQNQIEACKQFAFAKGLIVSEVITDVASSFNFKRKGLLKLLSYVFKFEIENIIIYSEDRITRFGIDLFKYIFSEFNVKFYIIDNTYNNKSDLFNELVSFIHYITSKIYGSRRYKKGVDELCQRLKK